MRTLTAFVVASAVLCSLAHAQEKVGIPETVAKELAFFVGDWTVEGDLAGKTLKGHWSAQWAPERQCILISSLLVLDGQQVSSNGVSGWDAGKEEIVTVQFLSNGVTEDIRYRFASSGVMKGVDTISPAGEQLKGMCEVRTKQPNEWAFKSTINVFERKKAADFTLRFVRSETEQAVSPAYEHLKDLEDFIGNWTVENAPENTSSEDTPEVGKQGEKVTYRLRMSWIQNKSIMQLEFITADAAGYATHECSMYGWDAVNKKIVYSGFGGRGGRVWGTAKKESPDKWVLETHWSDADGKQGTAKEVATMLDNNSTHVHEYTNFVFDGTPLPDWKMVFKRVK